MALRDIEWTSEAQYFSKVPITRRYSDLKEPQDTLMTDDITNCRNKYLLPQKTFGTKKMVQHVCAFHILPNLESLSAAIWTPFEGKNRTHQAQEFAEPKSLWDPAKVIFSPNSDKVSKRSVCTT